MAEKLTQKQILFCNEYLVDGNATQAAIRAGYSEASAQQIGSENMLKPVIQAYIEERQQQMVDKLQLTQEKVLQQYMKLAFFDIRNVFYATGGLKPTNEFDDVSAAAISSIESFEERDREGNFIGTTQKIKIADKRAALDSICRVMGFNAPDKVDLSTLGEKIRNPVAKLPDGTILEL